MEEKTIDSQKMQGTPYILMPYSPQEDEINLIDLWRILARRKVLVVTIAFVALIASIGYAILTVPAPLFRVQAVLSPPLPIQLDDLVAVGSPNFIFTAYVKNLQSQEMQQKFFNNQGAVKGGIGNFNFTVKSRAPSPHSGDSLPVLDSVTVSAEGTNAIMLAKSVNEFVNMVDKETVRQMIRNSKAKLIDDITRMRLIARQDREIKIAKLEDAILIAKKLGIKNIMAGEPPFMRGSKALSVEVLVLRQRKDDDIYISGIVSKKDKLLRLNSIDLDPSHVSIVHLNQAPMVPTHPIPPKSRHIIVKGLVGGLVLGVVAAFLLEFIVGLWKSEKELA